MVIPFEAVIRKWVQLVSISTSRLPLVAGAVMFFVCRSALCVDSSDVDIHRVLRCLPDQIETVVVGRDLSLDTKKGAFRLRNAPEEGGMHRAFLYWLNMLGENPKWIKSKLSGRLLPAVIVGAGGFRFVEARQQSSEGTLGATERVVFDLVGVIVQGVNPPLKLGPASISTANGVAEWKDVKIYRFGDLHENPPGLSTVYLCQSGDGTLFIANSAGLLLGTLARYLGRREAGESRWPRMITEAVGTGDRVFAFRIYSDDTCSEPTSPFFESSQLFDPYAKGVVIRMAEWNKLNVLFITGSEQSGVVDYLKAGLPKCYDFSARHATEKRYQIWISESGDCEGLESVLEKKVLYLLGISRVP